MRRSPIRLMLNPGPVAASIPAITAPLGGTVILIALLAPAMLLLLMFALDALENLLFPPSSMPPPQEDAPAGPDGPLPSPAAGHPPK